MPLSDLPYQGTLGDLATLGHDLNTYCRTCFHGGHLWKYEDLIREFGAERSLDSWVRSLVCGECGAQNADIRISVRLGDGTGWGKLQDHRRH